MAAIQQILSSLGGAPSGPKLAWVEPVDAAWQVNTDFSLECISSTFAVPSFGIIPIFTTIGDFIDFEIIAGGLGNFQLADGSAYVVICNPAGVVSSSDNPQQFLTPYGNGDVLRLTKISATQFSYQVNGGGLTTITQAFSGAVTPSATAQSIAANKIANPLTNIVF